MSSDAEMIERYRQRTKRQNERRKENFDRVSATLPKGTAERIKAQGLTVNGLINDLVLSFLDGAEKSR